MGPVSGGGASSTRGHGTPLVSVVIPAFNLAWLIGDTILSVRHQTLDDIEILVIDDGSTDDLAAVLAPHCAEDPRIRVIRQDNRKRRPRPFEFPLAGCRYGMKRRAVGSLSGTTRRGPYEPMACWSQHWA